MIINILLIVTGLGILIGLGYIVKTFNDFHKAQTNIKTYWRRYMKNINIQVNEIFGDTIQGEGPYAGKPAIFLRLSGCIKPYCKFCFGTKAGRRIPKIITSKGANKKITKVQVGDKLLTLDEKHNLVETEVKKVFNREVDTWMELTINNTKYFVTEEHPFFTKRGMIAAQDLKLTDIIYHINPVDKISFSKLGEKNPMKDANNVQKNLTTRFKNHPYLGDKPYVRGKKRTYYKTKEEGRKAVSDKMLGEKNPMKRPEVVAKNRATFKERYANGTIPKMYRTEEFKRKVGERMKGANNPMKRQDVLRKNILSHKWGMAKTEEKFQALSSSLGLNIHYVGDGSLMIGIKNYCPDFIIAGTKKLCEIYSSTFLYGKNVSNKIKGINGRYKRDKDWEDARRLYFKKYGYEVEFFDIELGWEHIKTKLMTYYHNGFEVQKIRKVSRFLNLKGELFPRSLVRDPLKVTNFSCEPYNTFLADYMWVHNCDSKYSWKEQGTSMTTESIVTELKKYKQRLLVMTGGEPLLQYEALKRLVHYWVFTYGKDNLQWETSGKVSIKGQWPEGKVVCSPKFINNKWQIDMKDPHNWVDDWKFVVANRTDMWRVKTFVKDNWLQESQIYIMPEGKTRDVQIKRMPKIAAWCAELGFNFSPRLHVLTWDSKRAV